MCRRANLPTEEKPPDLRKVRKQRGTPWRLELFPHRSDLSAVFAWMGGERTRPQADKRAYLHFCNSCVRRWQRADILLWSMKERHVATSSLHAAVPAERQDPVLFRSSLILGCCWKREAQLLQLTSIRVNDDATKTEKVKTTEQETRTHARTHGRVDHSWTCWYHFLFLPYKQTQSLSLVRQRKKKITRSIRRRS